MVYRMPTTNPRIQVTLPPSLFQLVARMATMQRASMSQLLRELLEAAEPALQRAVALMEAAERAKGAVHEGLGGGLMRAQERIEAELAKHLRLVDAAAEDLVAVAERIEGRRPGRARASGRGRGGATPNPPASNRGVKSGPQGQQAGPSQGPVKGSKGGRS